MRTVNSHIMLAEMREIAREAKRNNNGKDYKYVTSPDTLYMHSDDSSHYSDCFYVHYDDGTAVPGCLIGQWLHRYCDVSLDELEEFEGKSAYELLSVFVNADDRTMDLASTIQGYQDSRIPWLSAITRAELNTRNVVRESIIGNRKFLKGY